MEREKRYKAKYHVFMNRNGIGTAARFSTFFGLAFWLGIHGDAYPPCRDAPWGIGRGNCAYLPSGLKQQKITKNKKKTMPKHAKKTNYTSTGPKQYGQKYMG